ncbi:GNAT family N-acetyltransferase [Marinitenerispora sediminis]|uniref:GNAT family N-acetyltransferase n=1 Tax=Marinitenerispora sediminis TaxID=1931232 RepID=A0A368T7D0_9ACTN|nr:GNAT family N-acetyltransferase [Marinitenerispora sediminis]RCV50911.1 GNAT family N-acetyltransferase [Marinitenerispora sediminis]RCV59729.1 GNAT family N-acetyltransferase [Marinitenerispora sediminis]RCV59819.1 GNAT family N-acetyltransferase [Marinitenerispora sediminis]
MTGRGYTVRGAAIGDTAVAPMVAELTAEYTRRYGADVAAREMAGYPASDFAAPHGGVLLLEEAGRTVAGGAFRRMDAGTAEFKRIWTAAAHRRRGHGRRIVAALEGEAAARGYRRAYLTTGPAQPEAVALYLRLGYALLDSEGTSPDGSRDYYAFAKPLPG